MSPSSSKTTRTLIRSDLDRSMVLRRNNIVLLITLVLLLFFVPVIPGKDTLLTSLLLGVLVVSGLFAADFIKIAFRILATFGSLVLIGLFLGQVFPESRELSIITFLLITLFFVVVTIALVAHVSTAREVDGATLLAAINSYLLIGITLSILFMILDLFVPASFSQLNPDNADFSVFVYYGLVTLSTLGYGDITPDTALARSRSTFTALLGQLYLVIIMAIIIGKYLKRRQDTE